MSRYEGHSRTSNLTTTRYGLAWVLVPIFILFLIYPPTAIYRRLNPIHYWELDGNELGRRAVVEHLPSQTILLERDNGAVDKCTVKAETKTVSSLNIISTLQGPRKHLPDNPTTNTFTYSANNANDNFCMSPGSFCIIRYRDGVGNPGNSTGNMVGRRPIGTGYSLCWETSSSCGDAACSMTLVPSSTLQSLI
jgi:hypothetical protein